MVVVESDDPRPERRRGPSRLVLWSREQALRFWLVWPAFVLTLVTLTAGVSYLIYRSPVEIRLALTRTNLIGLFFALVVPPACVTLVWHRMRRRKRTQ